MASRNIQYSNGKLTFHGEIYWDDTHTGKRPGVVVFPEAFGLNDHTRERAQRLAELGFVALAADFHGEGKLYNDMETLGPAMQALYGDRLDWRSRARAALDTLATQPEVDAGKLAAIGFCFGGSTCLELARSGANLGAIVTFHGGLLPEMDGDAGRIRSRVMVCHGAEDPLVADDVIKAVMEEFRRDKVDWQFIYYGNAAHSFTNPAADHYGMDGLAYHAATDARSWTAMRNLFDEAFG